MNLSEVVLESEALIQFNLLNFCVPGGHLKVNRLYLTPLFHYPISKFDYLGGKRLSVLFTVLLSVKLSRK